MFNYFPIALVLILSVPTAILYQTDCRQGVDTVVKRSVLKKESYLGRVRIRAKNIFVEKIDIHRSTDDLFFSSGNVIFDIPISGKKRSVISPLPYSSKDIVEIASYDSRAKFVVWYSTR